MTCEEIRELLPAYALGLLDAEETDAVEAHLRDCRAHDADLVDLRTTGLALDMLREDPKVSSHLRESVSRIPTAVSTREAPTPQEPTHPRWWMAAAAVLALLAVFWGGWLASSYFTGSDAPPAAVELRFSYSLNGMAGELVRFSGREGDDRVTVIMAGLERLPEGRLYRLWAIRGGEWLQIGQCNTDEAGGWVGDFVFAISPGDELAVTVEAPSADPQPRAEPLLSSRASS